MINSKEERTAESKEERTAQSKEERTAQRAIPLRLNSYCAIGKSEHHDSSTYQ